MALFLCEEFYDFQSNDSKQNNDTKPKHPWFKLVVLFLFSKAEHSSDSITTLAKKPLFCYTALLMFKVVEAVTAGHPDKICDQIADALLDEFLRRDPNTRANIEVFGSHGMLAVGGTVVSNADFDCGAIARKVYEELAGHNDIEPFVNLGISKPTADDKHPSNDTTIVHGYATKETREGMPRAYVLAQSLARRMDDLRRIPPFTS